MELVQPGLGLILWMTIAFLLVLFILGKYAWRPIIKALKERESSIHDALNAANKARKEMEELQFSNAQLLKEAKNERDKILAEARKIKDSIIEESKTKAVDEANRILESARETIKSEKVAVLNELKDQLAGFSIEIAKKILKRELSEPKKQEEFIKELIKDIKFN
jgi:F-type H+-transporting ATPase subunit b